MIIKFDIPKTEMDCWVIAGGCRSHNFTHAQKAKKAHLPFSLRSAPKIFTALADAAEWILRQVGITFKIIIHIIWLTFCLLVLLIHRNVP